MSKNKKQLKKTGSSSNLLQPYGVKKQESRGHKRSDSGDSTGSITGYNIRSTLKTSILGMFGKHKAKAEENQIVERSHEIDMSPYAKHNINHGVMYTPDGDKIDPQKALLDKQ